MSQPIEKIDMRVNYAECLDLVAFFKAVMVDRKVKGLSCFNYDISLKYLMKFAGRSEIRFKSIDSKWVDVFKEFLLKTPSLKNDKCLSTTSARTYYSIVLSVISVAIQHGHLDAVIVKNAGPIKIAESKTETLSDKELEKLAEAKCDCITLKKAFLLSALTGIQWNELKQLTWNKVAKVHESYQLIIESKDSRIIPLSEQAFHLLDQTKDPNEEIFKDLKWNAYLYTKLNKWAIRAGILKNLTFQSARVTFVGLLHQRGIPVEIISELLGHRQPKSTVRLTQQYLSAVSREC